MISVTRLREMYAGVAIALLLLASTTQGAWFVAIPLALLGLILFPEQRRLAVTALAIAAGAAGAAGLLTQMFR